MKSMHTCNKKTHFKFAERSGVIEEQHEIVVTTLRGKASKVFAGRVALLVVYRLNKCVSNHVRFVVCFGGVKSLKGADISVSLITWIIIPATQHILAPPLTFAMAQQQAVDPRLRDTSRTSSYQRELTKPTYRAQPILCFPPRDFPIEGVYAYTTPFLPNTP